MTSHPLGEDFKTMMEKRQDQITDEGFLKEKKKRRKKMSQQKPKYRNILGGYAVHCSNNKGKEYL